MFLVFTLENDLLKNQKKFRKFSKSGDIYNRKVKVPIVNTMTPVGWPLLMPNDNFCHFNRRPRKSWENKVPKLGKEI
jgi:hypothetical protein